MEQLKEPFDLRYYLLENGKIFDAKTNKEKDADKEHCFKLLTIDGKRKKVSQKNIYRQVYNKEFCVDNISSLEGEKWKEIINTQGKYFVSNMGRIKSLDKYEAIILKPQTSRLNEYQRVEIVINGQRVKKAIHQLVAFYFLPFVYPADITSVCIHHKDMNKMNNKADNLVIMDKQKHYKLHAKERKMKANA